jgi:phosphopantothenate-cysteine ligase
MNVEPTTFSAEDYFATQTPPSTLHHDVEQVKNFVARQAKEGRKVALVTVRPLLLTLQHPFTVPQSGGTTVPLELNV